MPKAQIIHGGVAVQGTPKEATLPVECCADWPIQIEKINAPIVLQSIRAGRDLYDGIPFRFCPWCDTQRSRSPKAS